MKRMAFLLCLLLLSVRAHPQQYQVLYSFKGPAFGDGAVPFAGLLRDTTGNLYGTTAVGGFGGYPCNSGGEIGCGTVFELSLQGGIWIETVLHVFCQSGAPCIDGGGPADSLVMDAAGNLYGTTGGGGTGDSGIGDGVVFELSPPQQPGGNWTETVLYNFCSVLSGNNCLDGSGPGGNVIFDAMGNMYGMTEHGGSKNDGIVFELSPSGSGWTETVLHNFCTNLRLGRCLDGSQPISGLVFDKAGNLYGTTFTGGTSDHPRAGGVLFKLSPGSSGWTETVLANFNAPEGASPESTPSFDSFGNLYGPLGDGGPLSDGALFEWNHSNGKVREFYFNGVNGLGPGGAILVDALHRGFFGTTVEGGLNNPGSGWNGTAYQISSSGKETVLYNFCSQPPPNCADGANPAGNLVEDSAGNLYGTTESGGANNLGVVYEITP